MIDIRQGNRYDLWEGRNKILAQDDTDGGENGKRICDGTSADSAQDFTDQGH